MNVINEIGALPTRNHRTCSSRRPARSPPRPCTKAPPTASPPGHQCGLLRLHHRLRPHLRDRQGPLHGGEQARILGRLRWPGVRSGLGAGRGQRRGRPGGLQYANLLCNEQGMDPISFGATIGAVMELYELGVLTKEQIGIEAPFGSAEALAAGRNHRPARASARRSARARSACDQVRPPGTVDERQGPGIPGLRRPRHPGHGPGLRHLQPRRLPPARLHGGVGSAGHPGQDRSAHHRGKPSW
jgi:hypothetical protein